MLLLLPKTLLFHLCKHKPSSSVLTHTLKMQISLSISTSNIPYFLPPQEPTSEFLSTKYPFSTFRRGVVTGGGGGQKISVGGNHGSRVGGALFSLKGSGFLSAVDRVIEEEEYRKAREQVHRKGMDLEGYLIEGCSIGGHETCIVIPRLNCAFDIGRCPTRAIHQDYLFITHAHLDHIGGLPMYVATRGLYSLKSPTIFVPPCIKEDVEQLFEIHRKMSHVDLQLDLVALEVGDTYEIRNDLVVRPFQTNHVIPSQGYVVYSVRRKLKKQYIHLKGKQIEKLKFSGVEITDTILAPEVAFTGDTTAEFLLNPRSADALRAKVLITEATFLDEAMSIKHAREHGHTHLFELMEHAEWIRNKAIMLTHFSSRYKLEDIREAVIKLQSKVSGKVVALTEGFKPINP